MSEKAGGHLPAVFLERQHTEVVIRPNVLRIEPQRGKVIVLRRVRFPQRQMQVAFGEIDLGVVRRISIGEIQFLPG